MNDPRTPSRYFVSKKNVNPHARQIANEIIEGDAYLAMALINEEIKRRIAHKKRSRRTKEQYVTAALDLENTVFGNK